MIPKTHHVIHALSKFNYIFSSCMHSKRYSQEEVRFRSYIIVIYLNVGYNIAIYLNVGTLIIDAINVKIQLSPWLTSSF
jgi:hypothetical protein